MKFLTGIGTKKSPDSRHRPKPAENSAGKSQTAQSKFMNLMRSAQSEETLKNFEEAERLFGLAGNLFPDRRGPKLGMKRVRRLKAEFNMAEKASGIIKEIDELYYSGRLHNDINLVKRLNEFKGDLELVNWEDKKEFAKAAHFLHAKDIEVAINSYDPEMIDISVDFGYLVWPKKIQRHIHGKHVLDIGCGFGGYGNAFLATGVSSYTGLDPAMDLKSRRAKNKRIRQWSEMPKSPQEIMDVVENITLIQGRSEDIKLGVKFDAIVMHNVTEHLMDIESVFRGFIPIVHNSSRLIYLHHNYYGWNGHHKKPVKPSDFDINDPEQCLYADWNHVINQHNFPEGSYVNTGLNKITLDELKRVTEKYFNIEKWEEKSSDSATCERLSSDILEKIVQSAPGISERDLLTHAVFCIAGPKV